MTDTRIWPRCRRGLWFVWIKDRQGGRPFGAMLSLEATGWLLSVGVPHHTFGVGWVFFDQKTWMRRLNIATSR